MTNQIADYELLRELGRGSYGVSYLARAPERLGVDQEHVAVKVFGNRTRVNATTFGRAVAELKAVRAVRSEFLVRPVDVGQERGVFYYAMDYLPLGSLVTPTEPVDHAQQLLAVQHAARAAHDLHEAGIVHRQIKPGNILLSEEGGRLADVGLAHVLAPGLTVTRYGGAQALQYMDPAVLRGARPSRASDIWSLGVAMHVVLTGLGIYPTLQDDDVLLAMRTVATSTPTLSDALSIHESALVHACLAPRMADRPQTALEVAQQLQQFPLDVSTRR